MKNWIRFTGVLGLLLVGFAIVITVIAAFLIGFSVPIVNYLILIHLTLGIISLIAWFITSGGKNLGAAKEAMTGRKARFGYIALPYIAIFVGILVGVNWLANKYNKRLDLTEQGVYSLAPQSSSVVRNLKKPLKLVGLQGPAVARVAKDIDDLKDLFTLYKESNPGKVTTELFDPQAKPHLVEKYGYKTGNLVYVEYGEGDTKGVSRINEASEEAITNAIVKLQRGEAKKLYYVTGHNEPDIKSINQDGLKKFADSVGDEHLTIEEIFLAQKNEVPADAAAVMLVSPKKPLDQSEKELLMKYADSGGHLLLLADPRTTEDVKEIAEHFNIEVGDNVIIDQVQRLFSAPELGVQPVVRDYDPMHPISKGLGNNSITIFGMASTVQAKGKNENGITYTALLKSSPTAWGETDLKGLFSEDPAVSLDDSDVKGPVTIGVVYEKKLEAAEPKEGANETESGEKTSRVVVIGDSDWILNPNFNVYANRDLVMNCVNWVVGEESGIAIRPRSIKESLAPISDTDFLKILSASFLIPELILLTGLLVWWRRRTVPA
jgi:ABC-type uncharacterized transport system involved in gliding motility auxiliary subunit